MKLTYDPDKDNVNIVKHGLSLADALLVYVMRQPDEVRAISLRRASKQEGTLHAKNTH